MTTPAQPPRGPRCPIGEARPAELPARFAESQLGAHERLAALGAWLVDNIPIRPSNYCLGRGLDDGLIDHHGELASRSLTEVLENLVHGRGCVLCGGMALLMQSILVEAGHEAFCINFGDADGPISHVLVLAAVESGGCKEFAVYDPFLGLYIADEDGPASLSTIASAVKAQSVSPLRFRRIGSRYKRALVTTAYAAALGTGHRWVLPLGASRRSAISGGPEVQVDLKILAAVFGRDLQRWLVRSVKPATVFDLIRFPLGTSGEAGALALADTLSRTFTKV